MSSSNRAFTASSRKINNGKKISTLYRVLYFYRDIIISVIILKSLSETIAVTGFGGVIYGLIEIIVRGYTHWTMVITGGIVFTVIYLINLKLRSRRILPRCALGCVIITSAEFVVGCIVNLVFHLNVWDYSDRPYNILGQICPLFSAGWFFICIPAVLISNGLSKSFR